MAQGGNNLVFGEAVAHKMEQITAHLPIGIEAHLVADQPVVVEEAVGGFTKALWEAIAIVLAVSFVSLGLRAGVVVACSIPLVLGMVFVFMQYTGISLQRISLGALIIALGLLVDDAMITVEMMVSRLEQGDTLTKAATFAYTSTAFPMLTGTLVTVAGFIPIGLNSSSARPELLVDVTLPQNTTILETKRQMDLFEQALKGNDDVARWSSYVGQGAVRFYLPLDQQLANPFFGQIVIVTKSLEARARVQ